MAKRPSASSYAPNLPSVALATKPAAPWDRLANEDDRAYAFFLEYRNLDPRVRSIKQLIADERARRTENPDAVPTGTLDYDNLFQLSETFSWAQRASQWDDYVRYETDVALLSAARDAAAKNTKAAIDASEFNQAFFELLLKRGVEQNMLARVDFQTLLRTLPHVTKSAEVAMKIMRLATGESTENYAVKGQMVITKDAQIDLSRIPKPELRETRMMLDRLLKLSPNQLTDALNSVETSDVVEGTVVEVSDDSV